MAESCGDDGPKLGRWKGARGGRRAKGGNRGEGVENGGKFEKPLLLLHQGRASSPRSSF